MRHARVLVFAAILLFVPLAPGHAQQESAAPATLAAQLRQLVQSSGLANKVAISVIDTSSGRAIFEHRADTPMNPASNQKLVTAFAALRALGPEFRMRTAVFGSIEGDAVVGGLALRGYGDPTLSMSDLSSLARELADQGIVRCDRIIVDATYFDVRILPPAFEQQPREMAPFRAPISAIAVDRDAYTLRVAPGAQVGAPARVRLSGAGYFEVQNQITTADGPANVIADQRDAGARMTLRLSGSVPSTVRALSYRRRIENPIPWAGYLFLDSLRSAGIRCPDVVEVGPTPPSAALLATHESAPLAQILPELGKNSDNFVAEMIFKVMGAERHRPGRSEDAIAAVRSALAGTGVQAERITLVNGSGLFLGNRIAPQQLTEILLAAYRDPSIRSEYIAQLAIGGVDGTLENRLHDLPVPRVVRAKTGTLNAVIALSGYVLGPRPERTYAFSVIANDVGGQQGPARALADGVARTLATSLYHH
jgi:D-alanyl-D-alanine carboxypeptidase/D-alanyl-D-alanine-endopeptidase (penicillin-binding protein 4)